MGRRSKYLSADSASSQSSTKNVRRRSQFRKKAVKSLRYGSELGKRQEHNLEDPQVVLYQCDIATGYLRAFCDKEFNSENIRFVQVINQFHLDYPYLTKNATGEALQNRVIQIWNHYCSDSSETQICINSDLYAKYSAQIQEIQQHTADFKPPVAFFDPLRDMAMECVIKDIFPRFIRSDLYKEVKQRLTGDTPICGSCVDQSHLIQNATASTNSPTASIEASPATPSVENDMDTRYCALLDPDRKEELSSLDDYTLEDMMLDDFTFHVFLKFLTERRSDEAIKCYRQVMEFKLYFDDMTKEQRVDAVFEIFFRYLDPESLEEVQINASIRRRVAYLLAQPTEDMFQEVVKTLLTTMSTDHFPSFRRSQQYAQLKAELPGVLETVKFHNKPRRYNRNESVMCVIS